MSCKRSSVEFLQTNFTLFVLLGGFCIRRNFSLSGLPWRSGDSDTGGGNGRCRGFSLSGFPLYGSHCIVALFVLVSVEVGVGVGVVVGVVLVVGVGFEVGVP